MMDDAIHILLIEDDPAHAELIKRAFEERGDRSLLTIAHTLEEAEIQIKQFRPSLIIADWHLPDGESSILLTQNYYSPAPPVIIMTSYGSERNAVEAIKAGALDYIIKSSESMTDMPHLAERASRTVISVTRWVCPSVSRSRRSSATTQPSIVLS